jgi:flagellar biosynthesis protein FliQ
MGPDMVVSMARHLLLESLLLCAPMLVAACVVSLAVSLLQTLTGVQDGTLSSVPRLVVVFAVVLALMPWTVRRSVTYTRELWTDLHRYLD